MPSWTLLSSMATRLADHAEWHSPLADAGDPLIGVPSVFVGSERRGHHPEGRRDARLRDGSTERFEDVPIGGLGARL
jgi:hypothetical protein